MKKEFDILDLLMFGFLMMGLSLLLLLIIYYGDYTGLDFHIFLDTLLWEGTILTILGVTIFSIRMIIERKQNDVSITKIEDDK